MSIVGSDLEDRGRLTLDAGDIDWNDIVGHATPADVSVVFLHLEYLRPQSAVATRKPRVYNCPTRRYREKVRMRVLTWVIAVKGCAAAHRSFYLYCTFYTQASKRVRITRKRRKVGYTTYYCAYFVFKMDLYCTLQSYTTV